MVRLFIGLSAALILAAPALAQTDAEVVVQANAAIRLCSPVVLDAKAVEARAVAAGWPAFEDLGGSAYQRMSVRHAAAEPDKVVLALGVGEIAPTAAEPVRLFSCMVAVQQDLQPNLLDQVTAVFHEPIAHVEGASLWLMRGKTATKALTLKEMEALQDAPTLKLAPEEQLIELKEEAAGRLATLHVRIYEAGKP